MSYGPLVTSRLRYAESFHIPLGCEVTYSYPAIPRKFRSPFHAERNFEIMCGGGPTATELTNDEEIVNRVVAANKPIGFAVTESAEVADHWASAALEARLPFRYVPSLESDYANVSYNFRVAASQGLVGELFDVQAAITDYETWFGVGEPFGSIRRHLEYVAGCPLSFGLDFAWVETWFEEIPEPGERARCGLLLGYPLEATAAWIGQAEGVDGFSYKATTE